MPYFSFRNSVCLSSSLASLCTLSNLETWSIFSLLAFSIPVTLALSSLLAAILSATSALRASCSSLNPLAFVSRFPKFALASAISFSSCSAICLLRAFSLVCLLLNSVYKSNDSVRYPARRLRSGITVFCGFRCFGWSAACFSGGWFSFRGGTVRLVCSRAGCLSCICCCICSRTSISLKRSYNKRWVAVKWEITEGCEECR